MAESKDQELEQAKVQRKIPVAEMESIGLFDDDGDGEDVDRSDRVMETTGKKRNKRKREAEISKGLKIEEEEVLLQDPLEVFGSDIMMMILSYLDARSVALSLLVSRGWHGVAYSDRLWTGKCEELWLGKAHIPRSSQVRGLSKLAAYSLSVMDGKRARIMKEDLCDHVWEFHYKKAAPEYWRNLDPYWKQTGPLMRRYFLPDGSQTADPNDEVWGGHEACYSIVTSFVGEGEIREHYVRINRWPRMSVARKEDWSWEMSNHLYCYSSIPDAHKEGGTVPVPPLLRMTAGLNHLNIHQYFVIFFRNSQFMSLMGTQLRALPISASIASLARTISGCKIQFLVRIY